MAEKVSHHAAHYGAGTDKEHCSVCTMYRDHHCTKVIDPIEPYAWCRFFDPKEKKDASWH